jgi:hypothetical protein
MSMSKHLASSSSERVLTTSYLFKVAGSYGCESESSFFRWRKQAEEHKYIALVNRGLYLNSLAHPAVHLDECAGMVRAGAVVSLQTVLADCGALNNYTQDVTCVVPLSKVNSSLGKVVTNVGVLRFHHMPQSVMMAGKSATRQDAAKWYARDTPEKALANWIYLASSHHSSMLPPPTDMSLDHIDIVVTLSLAEEMDIYDEMCKWLEEAHVSGEEYSTDFGF